MSDLPQPHLYVRIPQSTVEKIKAANETLEDANLSEYAWVGEQTGFLSTLNEAIEEARRMEADRKELEQYYSKPLVPLDVPNEVWKAASAHYVDAQWTPAPNHHPEYRDVRAAFLATLEWIKQHPPEYPEDAEE